MQSTIETRGLSRKFKQVLAVEDLNLSIRKGELFGLVGPDGAGKTTTIQMLCGVLAPSAGYAQVLGFDTVKETERIRGKIGYMSEGFSLYGSLTVGENIGFFADLYKVPHEERRKRREELLRFSRLAEFVDRPAENLSGGMKKKLALCCTLIYSPEILLLDEPTLGVDPVSRREFWKILHDFRQEGITIFVTTPYLDEAERCDRVALLNRGKVVISDSPANLRKTLQGKMLDLKVHPQGKALKILRESPEVLDVQVFGERLHTRVTDSLSPKESLESYLGSQQIRLLDFREGAPSLEDVYVSALAAGGSGNTGAPQATPLHPEPDRMKEDKVAVSLERLYKTFGKFTAVNNLTLSVRQGEIFGFLGPNGSGKSTTIKMLTGLLRPTSGRATVNGFDVAAEAPRLKADIGYMSQKFSLYGDLTVEENINLYAGIYNVKGARLKARKEWVLRMAGLAGKESNLTRSLSGGWKQRLALGCAVIHEPKILFLDEPTSGVDPIARRYFWDLIYELAGLGVTVFVTTHYMDEAEHCHKLGFIYNGNLIALGSPGELKGNKVQGELLEVECSNLFEAIQLLTQSGFRASAFGSKIHIMVNDGQREATNICRILKDNAFTVWEMDWVPVSLEDLFVHLIEEDDRKREGLAV